ncbi:hypothetical protein OOU_Y34scaffold00207g15 [Pyricularia oryzae Y34]|uniref:Uncharacterized protein n=2 Tax=Pyricularia oryzae TaxID=318829 RepID=A0AA97P5N6_PYRO3|nr:hypothetical protein OOU_Y34scaffold00207g15 [Pyricularia oryzae Y34]
MSLAGFDRGIGTCPMCLYFTGTIRRDAQPLCFCRGGELTSA